MLFKGEKPRLQAVGTVDGGKVQSIVSLVEAGSFFGFREWMVHFRLRARGTPDTTSESVSDKFTISRRKAEAYFYQLKRLFRMREVPYGPPPALPEETTIPSTCARCGKPFKDGERISGHVDFVAPQIALLIGTWDGADTELVADDVYPKDEHEIDQPETWPDDLSHQECPRVAE